jgi:hypothetical protein
VVMTSNKLGSVDTGHKRDEWHSSLT